MGVSVAGGECVVRTSLVELPFNTAMYFPDFNKMFSLNLNATKCSSNSAASASVVCALVCVCVCTSWCVGVGVGVSVYGACEYMLGWVCECVNACECVSVCG